jgi:hypothetical protein
MAGKVLNGALPLAVFMLDGLLQNARAVQAGVCVVGIHIGNANLDDVRHHACVRPLLLAAGVSHDDRTVDPDADLHTVVLADPHALNEAKRRGEQPGQGGAYIGVHEHRDDGRGWDRPIAFHRVVHPNPPLRHPSAPGGTREVRWPPTGRTCRHNRVVVDAHTHWERLYTELEPEQLSWYQRVPEICLALIEEAGLPLDAAILDVGGGTSTLAGHLVAAGYADVTVADIAEAALERARAELGAAGGELRGCRPTSGSTTSLAALISGTTAPCFTSWSRRLIEIDTWPSSGGPYVRAAMRFWLPDGPTHCSGLPVTRYGADELSRIVGADFELVSSRLEQHRSPAGRRQPFAYAHLRQKADGSADG